MLEFPERPPRPFCYESPSVGDNASVTPPSFNRWVGGRCDAAHSGPLSRQMAHGIPEERAACGAGVDPSLPSPAPQEFLDRLIRSGAQLTNEAVARDALDSGAPGVAM